EIKAHLAQHDKIGAEPGGRRDRIDHHALCAARIDAHLVAYGRETGDREVLEERDLPGIDSSFQAGAAQPTGGQSVRAAATVEPPCWAAPDPPNNPRVRLSLGEGDKREQGVRSGMP